MNSPVDTASLDAARDSINQAAVAVQQLEEAVQGVQSPTIDLSSANINAVPQQPDLNIPESAEISVIPTLNDRVNINIPEQIQIPVEAVVTEQPTVEVPDSLNVNVVPTVTEQPVIDTPEQIEIPVTPVVTEQPTVEVPWEVTVDVIPTVTQQPDLNIPENVTVDVQTATETAEQQIANIQQQLQNVNRMQEAINTVANNAYILPNDTAQELTSVNREIRRMQAALDYIINNPFNLDSTFATMQIESLSDSIKTAAERQQELNSQLGNMPEQLVNVQVQANVPDPLVEPPEPVNIPVHWQSDNIEVFTNSGVDRFQQEIRSANNMLNTLNQTQTRIVQTASQSSLFPANAAADINNIQNRLQSIQQQIQNIESNPLNMGTDAANNGVERLREQLNRAITEQQNLNTAVGNMDVQGANEAYMRLSQTISGTERYIRDNINEQGQFNSEIQNGTHEANELMESIKGAVMAYASLQTMGKVIELSDTVTQTTARLNLIVDDRGSVEELQNKIFESAQRARGSYQATADAVSKLGLMAGDAFSGSDEIVAFMEQVNKQFAIAGTNASGIDAAMLQLTQAMGSGILRGEEYNSILEQAPNIIQAIADYMEVPKGKLKNMAAEGLITSDVVKNAMFAAADETNAKFESMPMTFSQIWTSFKNTALRAFQPVLQKINEILNSETFQSFVDNAIVALSVVAEAAGGIFDLLVSVGGVIADNWSWLSPIILGVASALSVYYGWLLLTKGAALAASAAQAVLTGAKVLAVPIYAALTGATMADTAAQWGLNAALYACPIVWIIILIIALIAVFYTVIAAINKFAKTSISATGIICGAFMVALAYIGNRFVTVINFIIDIFVVLWNFIAAFVNFFGNVFTDPVGAIARLFFDLVDTILSLLESLASAIDTIFGSNLAGSVQGWRNSLDGWVDDTFGKGTEIMAKVNAQDWHLDRFEYSSAWNKGYNFGKGVEEKFSGFLDGFGNNDKSEELYENKQYAQYNPAEELEDIGGGVGDIAGNTSDIADSVDISEEDLKYLRDIAEMETVNRFTTAEVKIEQTNNNTISSDLDIDDVVSGLTDAMGEAVNIITEGVHV